MDFSKSVEAIDLQEFEKALKTCGMDLTEEEKLSLFKLLDKDGNKVISWEELKEGFSIQDDKAEKWSTSVLKHIKSVFLKSRFHLQNIFHQIDVDGDGHLDPEEFLLAVDILLNAADEKGKISDLQLHKLFKTFDLDDDGLISYNEFLSSLSLNQK